MTFKIITLGCKVNGYESNAIREQFLAEGFTESKTPDVVMINTCSVTAVADQKSRQHIRKYAREFPNAVIITMGCYSQKNAQYILDNCGAHIVLGTSGRNTVMQCLKQYLSTKVKIANIDNNVRNLQYEDFGVVALPKSTRAFVKIQDGCNNFCSYCTIPYARGQSRSRNKNSILNEIKTLVNNGYKEIVITGIHTAHYGLDIHEKFSDLMEDILNIPNLYRVRVSSIEESEIDDHFISLLANYKNIANHLHMPLQSGSPTVLKRMHRKYAVSDFLEKVKKIRAVKPDIALTSDVIVGFPGETEEEFQETVNFIKEVGFSELHVFPFSPREGTIAASLPNQVDERIKAQRVQTLIELSNKLHKEYASKFIGQKLEVILEERNRQTHLLSGHTSNYLTVNVDLPDSYKGKVVEITYEVIE
ncbi:MAG: tRNA (N(6)-L-threonylcarbamoyladenosine(37)-C(2))-methylthiotransferase MtaB [Bacilli bacterium]|nr:tRNA (N(6)-L-threonylcarbamoyladenosine(37)-C(2))-methylthiotransferase MtaB [Bacilli bacterium]